MRSVKDGKAVHRRGFFGRLSSRDQADTPPADASHLPEVIVMKRSTIAALLLSISVFTMAFSASAKGHGDQKYPMPAAEFKAKQDAHVAKGRARMEERIKSKNLSAEQAKALRERFQLRVAKVSQVVAKVTADGTVTKEEAKEVRAVAHEGRGRGRGKGAPQK